MLKKLIGKLTKPKGLIYIDELGDTWTSCDGIPELCEYAGIYFSHDHEFQYRGIEKNQLGMWEIKDKWLGRNTELKAI